MLVTLVALGVIITVIIASVANGHHKQPSDSSSDNSSYSSSENSHSSALAGDSNSGSFIFSDSQSKSDSGSAIGDTFVRTARGILELEEKVPFAANGASLEGFDNSGFIYYVLLESGFSTCPRGLQEQTTFGSRLEYDKLKRGDLVFFCNEDNPYMAGYGGIYTGYGTMIACLMPGTYVDEIDISDSYYREHFWCGVSLS